VALLVSPLCRITLVRWNLIDPRTRDRACPRATLVRIDPPAGATPPAR
jgi:hypothetical protein